MLLCRHLIYTCPTADEVLSDGSADFRVLCRSDGTYASVETWPTCRAKADCSDTAPIPTNSSGLANTTSPAPSKEGDRVGYNCTDGFYLRDEDGTNKNTCCEIVFSMVFSL